MDGSRFDHIARRWATRRTALGGLIGGLLLPLLPDDQADARKKRQHNDRHKGRGKGHGRDKNVGRHGQQASSLNAEKKKKHKKKCKGGTLKCGKVCVTASTDAGNCGDCGNRCGSGQACVGGACQPSSTTNCPTGQIRCGSGCVDPKSDNGNCGVCGQACSGGERCLGGQCVDQPECVDQNGCGGSGSYNDLVCRNGRCVCSDSTKGICQRYPDGRGSCHICCPGGSGQCPGNRGEVCSYYQTPSGGWAGICNCPTDWDRCYPSSICVADTSTDARNCGQFCRDCQANQDVNAKGFCCNGNCTAGCAPGYSGSGCYPNDPCGSNCEPCAQGFICCNQGPGTEPSCIRNDHGGFCYRNI